MTARLREDADALAVLVSRAAEHFGIRDTYVEKDFWVTETLRAAAVKRDVEMPSGASAHTTFVFKGGTSLSRVHGLTHRFSEDIDLLVVFPEGASLAARHKVLKAVDADVSAHLGLAGQVVPGSSTTGIKRYTTYNYPSAGRDEDLKEGVLLELGSRGGAIPAASHSYRSLVCEFAESVLGEDDHTWAEFAAFDVMVLAPERTLLEKLAAVHDAAARENSEVLAKAGRHFYDVYCLLESPTVRDALAALSGDGIMALADDIAEHGAAGGFSWTPRPDGGYGDSPAFDSAHPSHPAILAGYQAAAGLVYGDVPSIDRVFATVNESRALL